MDKNLVLLGVFIVFILILVYYSLPAQPLVPDKVIVVNKNASGQVTAINTLKTKEYLTDGTTNDTPATTATAATPPPANQPMSGKSFYSMTDGEKIDFIINTYFQEEQAPEEVQQIDKENKYIKSLPKDDASCVDLYDGCPKWADNGECTINPEYMLYNCAKSCSACKLTPQEKHNLTVVYNQRPLPTGLSIYHGENYPGDFPFLYRLYHYSG